MTNGRNQTETGGGDNKENIGGNEKPPRHLTRYVIRIVIALEKGMHAKGNTNQGEQAEDRHRGIVTSGRFYGKAFTILGKNLSKNIVHRFHSFDFNECISRTINKKL